MIFHIKNERAKDNKKAFKSSNIRCRYLVALKCDKTINERCLKTLSNSSIGEKIMAYSLHLMLKNTFDCLEQRLCSSFYPISKVKMQRDLFTTTAAGRKGFPVS